MVEISKEEIPGSKRSMHGNIPTYSGALKGERLSSVFSSDGDFNFCVRNSPLRGPKSGRQVWPEAKAQQQSKRMVDCEQTFKKVAEHIQW